MKKIGFIGLGTMGTHFATNLIKAGREIIIHDIRRDSATAHLSAGAKWAGKVTNSVYCARLWEITS